MDKLPVQTTAHIIRAGIAIACENIPGARLRYRLFPEKKEGSVSLTVEADGNLRTLTFLLGERTRADVNMFEPSPTHDVYVTYDLVTENFISKFVGTWLDISSVKA